MYIAMNRFRVASGYEQAFEAQWMGGKRRLSEMKGYLEFHLLRGPSADDHTLYASHTVWESHEDFLAWTQSEQFRSVHARVGESKVQYLSGPHFEGFTVIVHEDGRGERRSVAA